MGIFLFSRSQPNTPSGDMAQRTVECVIHDPAEMIFSQRPTTRGPKALFSQSHHSRGSIVHEFNECEGGFCAVLGTSEFFFFELM